ncbi:NADAR family protein [Anaerosporobacter faecicola]|uniref:NADAR family protein n=1 Tax=Anaerosporobacter faecicola TaxID=2718714 RepID=UPI00143B1A0E|nr:NADAR family protein [Anaerosporobacter faecicola]
MAIYFYKISDEYGCFSNFSHYGFELNGKWWMTSEHYFQAQKFHGTMYEEEIRLLDNPMKVAEMGRNRDLPLREDWESVKDDIMRKAVLTKFQQNYDIRKILLATGDVLIVEKTTNDYYWGCGNKGDGKNMLGHILMEVREILIEDF